MENVNGFVVVETFCSLAWAIPFLKCEQLFRANQSVSETSIHLNHNKADIWVKTPFNNTTT